jgi:hypothetical protein
LTSTSRRRIARLRQASIAAAAGLVAALAIAGGASAAPVVSPEARDPLGALREPGDELRLSDDTSVNRWATAFRRAPVRERPAAGARSVGLLRFVSSSGAAEIFGVLRARMDGQGRTWLQVRVPGRPNGRVGWAPADAFGPLRVTRKLLIVTRRTARATLYRNGLRIWRAPVGVGKPSTPTPRGHFFIDRQEGAIYGPTYGPRILFTNAFSSLEDWPGGGIVGVHGTDQPGLVPGRPSHGCIRLHNADVRRLARLAPVGTPLLIR